MKNRVLRLLSQPTSPWTKLLDERRLDDLKKKGKKYGIIEQTQNLQIL